MSRMSTVTIMTMIIMEKGIIMGRISSMAAAGEVNDQRAV